MDQWSEDLGYIKGKLESLDEKVKSQDEHSKEIIAELVSLKSEISLYRHFIIFIRSVLVIGAFIVTMKFGAVLGFFGGKVSG